MQTRARQARAQLAENTPMLNRETTSFGQPSSLSDTLSRLSATSTSRRGIPQESVFEGNSIPRTPVEWASLRSHSTQRTLFVHEDTSASPVVAERQTLSIGGFSASRVARELDMSQRTESSNRDKTPRNSETVLNRFRALNTPNTLRMDQETFARERREMQLRENGHRLRGEVFTRTGSPHQASLRQLLEMRAELTTPRTASHRKHPQSEPQLGSSRMINMETQSPMLRSAPKTSQQRFSSEPQQPEQNEIFNRRQQPAGCLPLDLRVFPERQVLSGNIEAVIPTIVVESPRVRFHRVYSHPVTTVTREMSKPLSTPTRESCHGQRFQSKEGFGDAGHQEYERSVEARVVRRQASRCPQGEAFSDPWDEGGALRTGAPRTSNELDTDDPAEALGGGGMPGGHPEAGRGLGVASWRGQYLHTNVEEQAEATQPPVAPRRELSPEIPGTQVWEASRPQQREGVNLMHGGGVVGHAPRGVVTADRFYPPGGHVAQRKRLEHEDVLRKARELTRTRERETMAEQQRVVCNPEFIKNTLAPNSNNLVNQYWAGTEDVREVRNLENMQRGGLSIQRGCETAEGGAQELQPSGASARVPLTIPTKQPEVEILEEVKPADRMEELFTRLVTVLENRQEPQRDAESDSQLGKNVKTPLPSFSGLDNEDPREFCKKAEEQLSGLHPSVWATTAGQWLKGAAAQWFTPYKNMTLDWAFFTNRLQERFNNELLVSSLESNLYGVDQKRGESVTSFILNKLGLARRLYPEMSEQRIVQLILNRMCSEVKVHLQLHTFTSVEELTQKAVAVESLLRGSVNNNSNGTIQRNYHEDREPRRSNGGNYNKGGQREDSSQQPRWRQEPIGASKSPENRNIGGNRPSEGRPVPSSGCSVCKGPHWARDCPKQRQTTANSNGKRYQANVKPDGNTVARVVEATRPRDSSKEQQKPSGNASGGCKGAPEGGSKAKGRQ
ncbi:uncharacterized protein [Leptinotarsa decemlineata]|uniref:uncharacterized protein n=1 Tax=Leptinotarsa decemlineata TaxID=7539 RepID=UPI003D30AA92